MSYSLTLATPTASFSAYVVWSQKQTNLTEDEERELLKNYIHHGDLDAVRRLLFSHLKYVISIASGYLGYGLPMQDLVQEGNIGLMKAVKRFDLNHTVRLATFAVYWIKSEIHEYIIRNWRMVKIATTKAQRKLFFRLRKQLNYESRVQKNLQDIATSAGVTLQDAQHMHTRMMCYEESLESKAAYHDNDTLLGDVLSLPGDNPMETVTAMQGHALQRVHLEHAIAALNDRERWIVEQRWLLDDAQEKPTLEMLSQHLGVSIERARQLEVQALKRMRTFLHNKNIAFVDL